MAAVTLPMENEAAGAKPLATPVGDLGAVARRGKAAGAFRTISEVANDLNVPQHVLRFWETRFAQIRPLKRAGGRRYYRPEDVELLRRIRQLLYNNGYTIKGVQRLLRDIGRRPDSEPAGEDVEVAPPEPVAVEPPRPVRVEPPAPAPVAQPAAAAADPHRTALEAAVSELLEVREMLRKTRR
jgi:DNA-binding transcriptional MerR regulator